MAHLQTAQPTRKPKFAKEPPNPTHRDKDEFQNFSFPTLKTKNKTKDKKMVEHTTKTKQQPLTYKA